MNNQADSLKERLPYQKPEVEKIAIDTQISLAMTSEPPKGMDEDAYLNYKKNESKEMC